MPEALIILALKILALWIGVKIINRLTKRAYARAAKDKDKIEHD